MDCPIVAEATCYTILAGALKRIDSSVAGFLRASAKTIPMTQILGANPRRIGLVMVSSPPGNFFVLLSTIQDPGGYASSFYIESVADIRAIGYPQNGVLLKSPWYACYESIGVIAADQPMVKIIEWVQA